VISGKKFKNTYFTFANCSNITIHNCEFVGCEVNIIHSENTTIKKNNFINSGTYPDIVSAKHAIIFNQCMGGKIVENYFKEPIGTSLMSDIINCYKSNGTQTSPIKIEGNYLIGGGPSKSGGGIMLGDNMGNWQTASNNICINVGQYGMAIAGGANNVIQNNIVMGQIHTWSNVGIYVWGIPQRGSIVSNATVKNNTVSWTNAKGKPNCWWQGSNVSGITLTGNNFNAVYSAPSKPANVGT
jgi:hypothetical protein